MRQIVFNNIIKTHDDWSLILTKLDIPAPRVKTHYIETEYGHGFIDLSDAIDDTVFFGSRECTFEFDLLEPHTEREQILNAIFATLHGKRLPIRVPDRTQVYLLGRIEVEIERIRSNHATVTITATCDPYFLSDSISTYTKNITGATPNFLDQANFASGFVNWEAMGITKEKDMFENNIRLIYRAENARGEISVKNNTRTNLYQGVKYTLSFKALDYYLNHLNVFKVVNRHETVMLNANYLVDSGATTTTIYGSALKQYSIAFTPDHDILDAQIVIGNSFPIAYPHETGFYLTDVKLEKGNRTAWTSSLKDQNRDVFDMPILNGDMSAEATVDVTADTWITVNGVVYFFNERIRKHLNFRIEPFATKLSVRTNSNNKISVSYYERSL